MKTIVICITFLLISSLTKGQKIIFLHHSTGAGVYNEGNVAGWFTNYNAANGTHYQITERTYPNTPYPWENYPYDYWNLWLNNACSSSNTNIECLSTIAANYNVVVFKHCFPGSNILMEGVASVSSSVKTLVNYKLQYRALRTMMDQYPSNKFIVWTLVPLHRLATNTENASRAKQFVDWVKNDWLTEDNKAHPNIFIFDFWGYAAESNLTPANGKVNCLKYEYEKSHTGDDSHPNSAANQFIGPKFADFIVKMIQNTPEKKITQITVKGTGDASSINSDNGTLQMLASILPSDATNKDITWSISAGTDYATISASGLLTALKNGTVRVKGTAADGSGVFGTKDIVISNQVINVSTITVNGNGNISAISSDNGTLQMLASALPSDATNKNVIWSISSGAEYATISASGLLTALKNGTAKVRATAADGSGIFGTKDIVISNQVINISSISVSGTGYISAISSNNGTLQMIASILPSDATNKNVTWNISAGSNYATISSSGLLSALKNGTVTIKAVAADGSGIYSTKDIIITNQVVKVSSIEVKGQNNETSINTLGGSLQLEAVVLPSDAANKTVSWRIVSGEVLGTLNIAGKLTAVKDGTVKITATANDGSSIKGEIDISITGQGTSISKIKQTSIEFFPNPANKEIFFSNGIGKGSLIQIYSLAGIKMIEKEWNKNEFDISALKPDCYILVIKSGNSIKAHKLFIY